MRVNCPQAGWRAERRLGTRPILLISSLRPECYKITPEQIQALAACSASASQMLNPLSLANVTQIFFTSGRRNISGVSGSFYNGKTRFGDYLTAENKSPIQWWQLSAGMVAGILNLGWSVGFEKRYSVTIMSSINHVRVVKVESSVLMERRGRGTYKFFLCNLKDNCTFVCI